MAPITAFAPEAHAIGRLDYEAYYQRIAVGQWLTAWVAKLQASNHTRAQPTKGSRRTLVG